MHVLFFFGLPRVDHLPLISVMKTTIKQTQKRKDWYRIKQYPHIGLPLQIKDRKWIEPYVKNKSAVEKHAFYPFIHRKLKVRKFRKEILPDGSRSKLRKPSEKLREIYYANHLDSNIYSYYAELISNHYEDILNERGINESVTAYRKIKVNPSNPKSRNKCNVDFANDVFAFIKNQQNSDLVAITFDIKSFFDNLDHKLLKKYWRTVIKSGSDLPPNHYNVFRNITKFAYIEEDVLFSDCQEKILVERNPNIIREHKVKKKKYLRNQRAIAFCSKEELYTLRCKNLINANKYFYSNGERLGLRDKGIPQGSPISAILANLYLLDFDTEANNFLLKLNGIYRRYSDDMVIICSVEHENAVIEHFMSSIKQFKLEIQPKKTQVFHFLYNKMDKRHKCYEKNLQNNHLQNNTLFEYLGFQFDGVYTLLKNASLSGYYRKVKRSFAKGRFYSKHNKTSTKGELFKSRLYKRFTHLGAKRRRIFTRHPHYSDRFIISHKFDWGNYLTYAKLAAQIIPDNKIDRQLKRHWNIFHNLVKLTKLTSENSESVI